MQPQATNQESKKRIYCFDLDGTLVHKGVIHENDLARLKNPGNNLYIPATGRPLTSLLGLFERHGFTEAEVHRMPLVVQNGAVTYLPDAVEYSREVFSPQMQRQLIDLALQVPNIATIVATDDAHYSLHPDTMIREFAYRFEYKVEPYPADGTAVGMTKLMMLCHHADDLKDFSAAMKELPVESSWSLPTLFEVTEQGVDKGFGLKTLLKGLLGEEDALCLVAGDSENDVPLLAASPYSFAPQKSMPCVLEAARYIIDPLPHGLFHAIDEVIDSL